MTAYKKSVWQLPSPWCGESVRPSGEPMETGNAVLMIPRDTPRPKQPAIAQIISYLFPFREWRKGELIEGEWKPETTIDKAAYHTAIVIGLCTGMAGLYMSLSLVTGLAKDVIVAAARHFLY